MSDEQDPDRPAGTQRLNSGAPAAIIKGEPPFCSFCGRGKGEYRRLVAAPKVNICDTCVSSARQQLAGDSSD